MPKQADSGSWWTTLPGVLTGLAALLGAVATIIGLIIANWHDGPLREDGGHEPPSPVRFSLYDVAAGAVWTNGTGLLPFNQPGAKGQAWTADNYALEDGSYYNRVLCTHPQWTPDGFIRGEFTVPRISPQQHFLAQIGFAAHSANGVSYEVHIDNDIIFTHLKVYNGQLALVDVDLSPYKGDHRRLSVKVGANGDSTMDSFCWVDPRVDLPAH